MIFYFIGAKLLLKYQEGTSKFKGKTCGFPGGLMWNSENFEGVMIKSVVVNFKTIDILNRQSILLYFYAL